MSAKTPYKLPFGTHERKHIPTGNGLENTYEYQRNAYGRKVLVKSGERNQYQEIQEQLEETKIENILARAAAGDNTVFRPNGIYADTSIMPHNMIEAMQRITDLENMWSSVPTDIKRKYNFSVEDFVAKSGSKEWLEDMGFKGINLSEAETKAETPDKVSTLGQVETAKGEVAAE